MEGDRKERKQSHRLVAAALQPPIGESGKERDPFNKEKQEKQS
jgi:hypothetical protein